jgi:hypothetical protein
MAYLELAELKRYLGITSNSEDTLLGEIIDNVTREITTRTHRHFELESTHGHGPPVTIHAHYFSPRRFVDGGHTLDAITLNLGEDLYELTALTNGDGVAINIADVTLLPFNMTPPYGQIRIKADKGIYWTGDNDESIVVTGKWGYSQTVPADIKQAALIMCAHYYKQRPGSPGLGAPVISADGVVIEAGQTMSDAMRILKSYIRRS